MGNGREKEERRNNWEGKKKQRRALFQFNIRAEYASIIRKSSQLQIIPIGVTGSEFRAILVQQSRSEYSYYYSNIDLW